MIKHLVISGGFYNGIKMYGALHELGNRNFYNINNIESIYCTSIGSLIGTLLSLKIDTKIIYDYIHKRPWYKISKIKNISFQKKGLLDKTFVDDIMKPVLQSKNLELNITLADLYKYTNIDIHIFSTKVTDMSLVDISYKTHPNLPIIDAIYMSSAIPYFLEPYFYNNDFYIDGGVLCNYPLDHCQEDNNSIFGIKTNNVSNNEDNVGNDSSIIQYFIYLNLKLFKCITTKPTKTIKHNLVLDVERMNTTVFNDIIYSSDKRLEFLQDGQRAAATYLENIKLERAKVP